MKSRWREGQRVLLRASSAKEFFVARLEEADQKTLAVSAPLRKGQWERFRPGTEVEVQYFGPGGGYWFVTVVEEFQDGRVPLLRLRYPREVHRAQRRSYVRWSAALPLTLIDPEEGTPVSGRTVDLSGGGMAALLPRTWAAGKELEAELELPGEIIAAQVRVMRSQPVPGGHRVALSFIAIAETDRESIIRYLFARQREFLRSGLREEEEEGR